MKLTGPKVKKDLISSIFILLTIIIVLVGGSFYLDWSAERDRMASERAVLIGNGYSDVIMHKERGTCPRGVYSRWYDATNPEGVKERGVVCVTYGDDTPYIIPSFKGE